MEIIGEEVDTVIYDEETLEVIESCKGCPIAMPFSWKVCVQCQRNRVELFRTSTSKVKKMIEFTEEQLKYLEDLLWLPCCHITGTHNPSHYRDRKYVCVYQKEKALHRLCETLGLNPQIKSRDDCYWCNEGTEAKEERKGEGLRLFQSSVPTVRNEK